MDLDCAQLDTQSGFQALTSLTKDIREFPWGHGTYSFCQSTAVSARYEWDVEADLPNQILLSFSKFRCKIRQALWITRATVKAVGERSPYLVRIAPPSTKDPALLNPTSTRFSLFDVKTQLMLFPLGED